MNCTGIKKRSLYKHVKNSKSTMKNKPGYSICLICARQGYHNIIITNFANYVSASGTPLAKFLIKIIGEEPCYSVSQFICQQCFLLLDRLDTYQARAAEISNHISSRYKETKFEFLGNRQRISELIVASLSNIKSFKNGTTLNVSDELSVTVFHEALPRREYKPLNGSATFANRFVKKNENSSHYENSFNYNNYLKRKQTSYSPKASKKQKQSLLSNNNNININSYGSQLLSSNICESPVNSRNESLFVSDMSKLNSNHTNVDSSESDNEQCDKDDHESNNSDCSSSGRSSSSSNNSTTSNKSKKKDNVGNTNNKKKSSSSSSDSNSSSNSSSDSSSSSSSSSSSDESSDEEDGKKELREEKEILQIKEEYVEHNTPNDKNVNEPKEVLQLAVPKEDAKDMKANKVAEIGASLESHFAEAVLVQSSLASNLLQSFLSTSLWMNSSESSSQASIPNLTKQQQKQIQMFQKQNGRDDDVTVDSFCNAAGSIKDKKKRLELKNTGQSYINTKGKLIEAKRVWPQDCSRCPLKCNGRLNEDNRLMIFADYWGLADYDLQREYLATHMKREERIGPSGYSRTVVLYFLTYANEKYQVCRQFFLKTLDVSEKASRIVLEKKLKGELGVEEPPVPSAVSDEVNNSDGSV